MTNTAAAALTDTDRTAALVNLFQGMTTMDLADVAATAGLSALGQRALQSVLDSRA